MTTHYISTKDVAAALRARLKAEFPGVKFAVRVGRGTSAAYIGVTWTDGPAEGDVAAITSAYEGARWNGYDDRYDHTNNEVTVVIDGKEVTGKPVCDGVQTRWEVSDEAKEEAGRIWSEHFDGADWRTAGMSDSLVIDGEVIHEGWAPAQVRMIARRVVLPRRWAAAQAAREEAAAQAPARPARRAPGAVTVAHTLEGGTTVTGTRRRDGAAPILRRHGFDWDRPARAWYLDGSHDRPADIALLEAVAANLREAGFTVTLSTPEAAAPAVEEAPVVEEPPAAYRGVPVPRWIADSWDTITATAWREAVDATLTALAFGG